MHQPESVKTVAPELPAWQPITPAIEHQVRGTTGFTSEHNLHFLTPRLWSWRDEFGKDSAWHRLLGRHMAQAGADIAGAEITTA